MHPRLAGRRKRWQGERVEIAGVEWRAAAGPVPYAEAMTEMETRADAVAQGAASELAWLLEHPHVYTAGTSARADELLDPRYPVVRTGRGGRYTYHGPGQRVGYLVLDLNRRGRDVRCYVHALEGWLLAALAALGVAAHRAPGRVGLWVDNPAGEAKIAAIGVRVRRWVTTHGFALNVDPALDAFGGIVPCGLPDYPVTSLAALGRETALAAVDAALRGTFPDFLQAISESVNKVS